MRSEAHKAEMIARKVRRASWTSSIDWPGEDRYLRDYGHPSDRHVPRSRYTAPMLVEIRKREVNFKGEPQR